MQIINSHCVTSWLKSSSPRHSIHAWSSVRCVVVVLFTRLLFLSVPLLFFQTFQTPSSAVHKKFMSKDLRDFRLGTVASNDHETPLTHREAFQVDLQQNNVYNPLSDESKAMIREMGNVELFELCEKIPKVQCSECLLCWNQGIVIVNCICGHLLKESESSHSFHQRRLDVFSIQNYVIKKGRLRGVRHGEIEAQKEHFVAHNARRRCLKKKIEGIHDRFQRESTNRDSQLKNWLD